MKWSRPSTSRFDRQAIGHWLPVLAGIALAVYGLLQRNRAGLGLAIGGAPLAARNQRGLRRLGRSAGAALRSTLSDLVAAEEPEGPEAKSSVVAVNTTQEAAYAYWLDPEKRRQWLEYRPQQPSPRGLLTGLIGVARRLGNPEWDITIVRAEPHHRLHVQLWQGGRNVGSGMAEFRSLGPERGCEVRLRVNRGRASPLAALLSGVLLGGLSLQLRTLLGRFKAVVEAGEVPTTAGQPAGPPRTETRG
jgi:uncharacterized membrane protein